MDKPDFRVVARFIEILYNNGPLKKTQIQMRVGLNYSGFKEYLEWLLDRGLVAKTEDGEEGERIMLTPKGEEAYLKIVTWIKEMMQGVPL